MANVGGRVRGCYRIPGYGSCVKQMHSSHNGKCRHCRAPVVRNERIKVFGL
jgi:hypothetical protein